MNYEIALTPDVWRQRKLPFSLRRGRTVVFSGWTLLMIKQFRIFWLCISHFKFCSYSRKKITVIILVANSSSVDIHKYMLFISHYPLCSLENCVACSLYLRQYSFDFCVSSGNATNCTRSIAKKLSTVSINKPPFWRLIFYRVIDRILGFC